jgi:hypothetical protein
MADFDVIPAAPLRHVRAVFSPVEDAFGELQLLLQSFSLLADPDFGNGTIPPWLFVLEAHVRRLVAAHDAAVSELSAREV